ncbi:hypothetical protein NA57DRAFT_62437 [Rhizodiscina lignyota]|uniref:DUF7730 domain-containing protein n=1 Tax=Rhizodiscina lignyota TaxID=1504668 RepID=A0A9P4I2J0_9PEZI|nr:hypothetical protein NA57DRAFT_62437 [Rhizodiscina lignyota]
MASAKRQRLHAADDTSTSNSPPGQPPTPTLLGLPAEVRNIIYEYCLVPTDDVFHVLAHDKKLFYIAKGQEFFRLRVRMSSVDSSFEQLVDKENPEPMSTHLALALLRTNKQIHTEVSPLLWENEFALRFESMGYGSEEPKLFGSKFPSDFPLHLIRHLSITIDLSLYPGTFGHSEKFICANWKRLSAISALRRLDVLVVDYLHAYAHRDLEYADLLQAKHEGWAKNRSLMKVLKHVVASISSNVELRFPDHVTFARQILRDSKLEESELPCVRSDILQGMVDDLRSQAGEVADGDDSDTTDDEDETSDFEDEISENCEDELSDGEPYSDEEEQYSDEGELYSGDEEILTDQRPDIVLTG